MISQVIYDNPKTNIGEMIPHIVQTACAYKSSITFAVDQKRVNAKSIMGVMALASQRKGSFEVYVDGADEQEALQAIAGLLA